MKLTPIIQIVTTLCHFTNAAAFLNNIKSTNPSIATNINTHYLNSKLNHQSLASINNMKRRSSISSSTVVIRNSPNDANGANINSQDQLTIDTSSSSTESSSESSRFQPLLEEVGLDGQLSTLKELQSKRLVSSNGVFCNRELKLDGIRAIGFDMDYTVVQYKQPAFDKLAFDGAKVCDFVYVCFLCYFCIHWTHVDCFIT